jgi:hypothetical protein
MNNVYENIISNVRTTSERDVIYAGIETLMDSLYRSDGRGIADIIDTDMPHSVAKPLKLSFKSLPDLSVETAKQFLDGLRDALLQLPVLTLEVAFDPTDETVATLIAWVRENIGPSVILELSVDRSLLGGARIAFGGRFLEKNLAYLIEDALQQKQDSIQQILYG